MLETKEKEIKEHYTNLVEFIGKVNRDVKDNYGSVVVYVTGFRVLDVDSIDIGDKLRSEVWVGYKAITENFEVGEHFICFTIENKKLYNVTTYASTIIGTVIKVGEEGKFYKGEAGEVKRTVPRRGYAAVTYSAGAFTDYLLYGERVEGEVPIICGKIHLDIIRYIRKEYRIEDDINIDYVGIEGGTEYITAEETTGEFEFGIAEVAFRTIDEKEKTLLELPYIKRTEK